MPKEFEKKFGDGVLQKKDSSTPDSSAPDLTSPQGVASLMESSKSAEEWNANCDRVKAANNGYPKWWYEVVISAGVLERAPAKWER